MYSAPLLWALVAHCCATVSSLSLPEIMAADGCRPPFLPELWFSDWAPQGWGCCRGAGGQGAGSWTDESGSVTRSRFALLLSRGVAPCEAPLHVGLSRAAGKHTE